MGRVVAIVALALACYANALGGSFHFDDAHAIVQNPSIRSLANLGEIFSDAGAFSVLPQNQGYRPLLLASYAFTAAFTGVDARAFLAVNLAVHVLCALLVFTTLKQTLRLLGRQEQVEAIAFVGALLFACHPLFSECVNYVSARSESLSGLLVLASLSCYLRARDDSRWLTPAVLAIAGALLTKPTAAIFPALLAVFELAAAERHSLRRIAPRWLALTATVLVMTLLSAQMTPALAFRSASNLSRTQYLRSELPALWHYVRLFVWPVGQSADADYPVARSFLEPRVLVAGAGLLAVTAFSVWGVLRRRCTGTALACAWFLLCLAPASSLVPLAEIVNEHRPYLGAASLCALAAAALVVGLPRLLRRPRLPGPPGAGAPRERAVTVVAAVLVLVPLAAATVARNRVWRDELTLWADVVAQAPESARGQTNYGLALMGAGHSEPAEFHLREAVRLAPYYPYAHLNLGQFLLEQGRSSEALSHLDRAVALGPDVFWAAYYRGLAAERLGEPPERRLAYLDAALRLSPNSAEAWYHLALARQAAQDGEGALAAARRATELHAGYDERFLLASLLLDTGHLRAAQTLLRQLQAERPDDARVGQALEQALARGGARRPR